MNIFEAAAAAIMLMMVVYITLAFMMGI